MSHQQHPQTIMITIAPPDRDVMHEFLDRLPDEELGRIGRIMAAATDDPVLRSLILAEYDDEPITDEERESLERSVSGQNEVFSWDEATAQLGLDRPAKVG